MADSFINEWQDNIRNNFTSGSLMSKIHTVQDICISVAVSDDLKSILELQKIAFLSELH